MVAPAFEPDTSSEIFEAVAAHERRGTRLPSNERIELLQHEPASLTPPQRRRAARLVAEVTS